ncbi:MAG: RNB domain-containing ribonuclease [Desulfovibrio sp.]|jgi:exoribonuclease-2|nr:RNB domain-containing ribonuclease [Desulfovibrio sp.]
MTAGKIRYPGPGCVVEFLQGNSPTLALVLAEQSGRLKLYTQNHREVALSANRLLPWSGPDLGPGISRREADQALEQLRLRRETLAEAEDFASLWEVVQGEENRVSAEWMASLLRQEADIDFEAALGRRLLGDKIHFRFNPPDFDVFPREVAEKRLLEAEAARLREAASSAGASFFRLLWEVASRRRPPPAPRETPEAALAERLRRILLTRIAEPDSDGEGLWKALVKGLPDHPHQALLLAAAWGLVPEHHNFWLDRAGFARGEDWADEGEAARFRERSQEISADLPEWADAFPAGPEAVGDLFSVDAEHTRDRDDAFSFAVLPDGSFRAVVALACPALAWPFGALLDKAVLHRATSLYLPEGDEHMLPGSIGWRLFGLDKGALRPALVLEMRFDGEGRLREINPLLRRVRIADNLFPDEVQGALLAGSFPDASAFVPGPRLLPHASALAAGLALARKLQAGRLASGAVIIQRPDPEIRLREEKGNLLVSLDSPEEPHLAHLLVGETMIAANAGLAAWALERDIPLFHRTQDVALPREFSGIWEAPQDVARIVRALPPAVLETQPRRHAGLGLAAYATVSSPIRRYVDLFNQGQILSFLREGAPRASAAALASLLPHLSARQDAAGQVQRFRPRYWKLLFFRQQGDKRWWDGVVTEENESFASVALPWAQIVVRGRRGLLGEKAYPGQAVQIRLGKVDPLLNEIQILETRE